MVRVEGPRAPGRPRDAGRDRAIIDATLRTLAEAGLAGMSMEAVAGRAGVGKATLYRRWSTKEALLGDAIATLADSSEPPDTGSLRGDLVAWLVRRRDNADTVAGRIMPRLLAEKDVHPELLDTYRDRVIRPDREIAAVLLRQGIARGDLPGDLDLDFVTDMLVGPLSYRQFTRSGREITLSRITRVVDLVLSGLAAPA